MIFTKIIQDAQSEIGQRPVWEQAILWLWLCGPFFFLIERSPADIWIIIIDLAFIIHCLMRRDWQWTEAFWVRGVLLFLIALMLSALFSALPAKAAEEGLLWIRFPLLAMASAFWLGKNTATLRLMLVTTGVGVALMMLILLAEIYITYEFWSSGQSMSARLSWPYGDPVSGNYLGKFGLVSVLCAAAAISSQRKAYLVTGIIGGFLIILFTVLTGERINALLAFCTMWMALIYLNIRRAGFLIAASAGLVGSFIFAVTRSDMLISKFTDNLMIGLFNTVESGYIHLWMTGIELFKTSPFTGIGVGMFRFICPTTSFSTDIIARCDNHPHQYYVQLLAETGIIGLIAFVVMIGAIIYATWRNGRGSTSKLKSICFIAPFALFFPIQATADLFGQWVNAMMWYAIALAMAVSFSDIGNEKQTPLPQRI